MMAVANSDDPKPHGDSSSALGIVLNEDPSPSLSETLPNSVDTEGVYKENQPLPAGVPGCVPVEVQEFTCHGCGEQKVKVHNVFCDGCKVSLDLDCAKLLGGEAEKLDGRVCGKRNFREARSEELQDLRQSMVFGGHSEVNTNEASNKRMKMVEDGNLRPWSDLHEDLLELITRRLGMVDYLMFGRVCRSWKLHASAYKQEFMASQAPHLLRVSSRRKSCYFYDIFERKTYKAVLPNLVGRFCAGITGGYLVMDSDKEIAVDPLWLVNPITSHELYFPRPPCRLDRTFLLSVPMPRGELMLVGLSMIPSALHFCRSSDVRWTTHELERHSFGLLVDAAFFKGKLYVVNHAGRIFQFDPSSPPYCIKLGVQRIPGRSNAMRLAASDEELFLISSSVF